MEGSDQIRREAVKRLKRKRQFKQQLVSYVLVNAFLIAIWAIGDGGFFWPGFVLAGWGLGLAFSAQRAYGSSKVVTEEQIQHEMDDLRKG